MRNNLTLTNFYLFSRRKRTMEEMVMNEVMEATAVETTEEVTDIAVIPEVEGEVVTEAEGGINSIVAAGVGLGITGIVGGITYMLMRKKKNKNAKNDKKDETKKAKVTKKPATEEELTEYIGKLAEEMKAANAELLKIKNKDEESEEEVEYDEEK